MINTVQSTAARATIVYSECDLFGLGEADDLVTIKEFATHIRSVDLPLVGGEGTGDFVRREVGISFASQIV